VDPQQRDKLEQQISAYLDGELGEKETAELERLLTESDEARQVLAELQRTVSLVRGLPQEQPPDDLFEAVTSQLEREALLEPTDVGAPARSGLDRWARLRRFASVAAVLVAAVGIGYLTITGNNQEQRKPAKEAEIQLAEADRSEPAERQMRVAAAPAETSEREAVSDRRVRARGVVVGQRTREQVDTLAAAPSETAAPQVELPSKAAPPPARQPAPKPAAEVVEHVAPTPTLAKRLTSPAGTRGDATVGESRLVVAAGDHVVRVPSGPQQVTMLVTAGPGKPVWQASLELSQALAEEDVTFLPVGPSDRGTKGRRELYYGGAYELKAEPPGVPLYRFRASPEQVARLSSRVARVAGVQVDVQGMDGKTSDTVAGAKEEQRERLQVGDFAAGLQAQRAVELKKGVPTRSADVEGFAPAAPSEADLSAPTDKDEAALGRAAGRQLRLRNTAKPYETDTAATRPALVADREPTRHKIVAGVPVETSGQLVPTDTQPSQAAAEVEVTVLIRSTGQQRER